MREKHDMIKTLKTDADCLLADILNKGCFMPQG